MTYTRLNPKMVTATPTRKLGTGGNVKAFRHGDMLIVSGGYSGCTVSSTYTWADLFEIPASTLGVTSLTQLGSYVDVSGGGPSYQGNVADTGGQMYIGSGTIKGQMQTQAAFSSKIVRFIFVAVAS